MNVILLTVLAIVLLLNIRASIIVSRATFLVKERKTWQLIFIWCVPILGAILALYFHTEPKNAVSSKSSRQRLRGDVALSAFQETDGSSSDFSGGGH